MTKEFLRQQILTQLRADLTLQTSAAQLARDEAIDEESRPENKYDTHSQEAAYLAEGQARLAAEITESIAIMQSMELPDFTADAAIAVGALVEVGNSKRNDWYLIAPRAGGMELKTPDGREVLLITPSSPLGRQLMGRRRGDQVQPPGRPTPAAQTIRQIL